MVVFCWSGSTYCKGEKNREIVLRPCPRVNLMNTYLPLMAASHFSMAVIPGNTLLSMGDRSQTLRACRRHNGAGHQQVEDADAERPPQHAFGHQPAPCLPCATNIARYNVRLRANMALFYLECDRIGNAGRIAKKAARNGRANTKFN